MNPKKPFFTLLCLTAVLSMGVHALKYAPSSPVVDVPFLVTPDAGVGNILYLSVVNTCGRINAVGGICDLSDTGGANTHNSTTCVFTMTAKDLTLNAAEARDSDVPMLYWCDKNDRMVGEFQLGKMNPIAPFLFHFVDNNITFTDVTPPYSIVGLYTGTTCNPTNQIGPPFTLDAFRSFTYKPEGGDFRYLCVTVRTVLGSNVTVNAGGVVMTSGYAINGPFAGVRHTTVRLDTDGGFTRVALSKSPTCIPLAQAPQLTSSTGGYPLTIEVPKGLYYFCGFKTAASSTLGAFIPYTKAMFEVQEYGIQPHTMYTELATNMRLTMDSPEGAEIGLFRQESCKTAVVNWGETLTWTVNTPGKYYACFRQGDAIVRSAQITVLPKPTVTYSRSTAVRGLSLTLTLDRRDSTGYITSGLSSTVDCGNLSVSQKSDKTGSKFVFRVPTDAAPTMYTCVSTPLEQSEKNDEAAKIPEYEIDEVYIYQMGSVTTTQYPLTYPPLRTQKDITIKLDRNDDGGTITSIRFQPSWLGCDAAMEDGNKNSFVLSTSTNELKPVNFPTDGEWKLCACESDVLGNTFSELRNVTVYGNATFSPHGLLKKFAKTVSISKIPSGAKFYFVETSRQCNRNGDGANQLYSGTSSLDTSPTVTDTIQYSKVTKLTLCVEYKGATRDKLDSGEYQNAGELSVGEPIVYPSFVVAGSTTNLAFAVPDNSLLVDSVAYLSTTATSCSGSIPSASIQLNVMSPGSTAPYVEFSTDDGMIGNTYLVCVGHDNTFISAGTVQVMKALELSLPGNAAATLTSTVVTFTGETFEAMLPDRFVVVSSRSDCVIDMSPSDILAKGVIKSNGVTDPFLAPVVTTATDFTICVGKETSLLSDTVGYTPVGNIAVYNFTSSATYVQLDRMNDLQAWPLGSDTSLFLTPCSGESCTSAHTTCKNSKTRYITSPSTKLTGAPVGTYLVCQESKRPESVVGSNTTVQVVEPFELELGDVKQVKQYVPFKVTIKGGPSGVTRADPVYNLRVQPAVVDCSEEPSESETFTVKGGVNELTVTEKVNPKQDIVFCLKVSETQTINAGRFYLDFYMSPPAIVGSEETKITSSAETTGISVGISNASDCKHIIASSTLDTDKTTTLTIESCGTHKDLKAVYYCEMTDGVSYTVKGKMVLLRRTGCTGGAAASIQDIQVAPGVKITDFGIDKTVLSEPRLSRSNLCTNLLPRTVNDNGYVPRFDEDGKFFVCARLLVDNSYLFTTAEASLTVDKYTATPTSVLSRYNTTIGRESNTTVTLNYATPSATSVFSVSPTCVPALLDASGAGFASSSREGTYKSTGVNGLVYVCTKSTEDSNQRPIATLLSVTPPAVSDMTPAIVVGKTFRAKLRADMKVNGNLIYSMVFPETDYLYKPYFVSDNRSVFLSSDNCKSGLPNTVTKSVNGADNSVSFEIPDDGTLKKILSVSLCAGTPAGIVVVADVPVLHTLMTPDKYVSDSFTRTFIPSLPKKTFKLVLSNSDCSVDSVLPVFETNEDGYGYINLTNLKGGAAKLGTYWVCNTEEGSSVALIEVIKGLKYDVTGSVFVVGVPGVVTLLDDLTKEELVSGLSTSSECESTDGTYGDWEGISDTSIIVTATSPKDTLYLCASVKENNTITALPLNRGFSFVQTSISFPFDQLNTCDSFTVDQCVAPGYSLGSGAVLGIVYGNCCDRSAQSNALGVTSMDSGSTCALTPDASRVREHPSGTKFSVCAWSRTDPNYCVKFGETNVSTDCTSRATGGDDDGGLSTGALIAIIICSIVAGLLLIALIIFLIWYCCCRKENSEIKNKQLVALRHLENPEYDFEGIAGSQPHPLMYYPAEGSISPPTETRYSIATSRLGNVAENMEDDERDQIILEEARERYQLRLLFNEQTELIHLAEKEGVTFGDPFPVDDTLPVGEAVPEWKPLEIDLDDPDVTCVTDHELVLDDREGSLSESSIVAIGDETIDVDAESPKASLKKRVVPLPDFTSNPYTGTPDDDENELSTTNTQLFHDEKKFLLAQEDTRRRRLRNWEEEERAYLGAVELAERNGEAPPPPPTTEGEERTPSRRRNGRVSRNASKGEHDEDDVHHYDAPYRPAGLPALPKRPRIEDTSVDPSDDVLAQVLGVRFDASRH